MGGHSSGGLFPGTLGDTGGTNSFSITISQDYLSTTRGEITNPVLGSIRTGSALKTDPDHAFPDIVDNYAGYACRFRITGGDGVTRLLLQLEGSLNGVPGIFEWIVDPRSSRGVTHRRFIRGGIITGKPNQHPQRS